MTYDEFFDATIVAAAAGTDTAAKCPGPYHYQRELAAGPWPDMLDIRAIRV